MTTIYVDRVIQRRDVDAALYLLTVLLGVDTEVLGEKKARLLELQRRLRAAHQITTQERQEIVTTYNEVMFDEG